MARRQLEVPNEVAAELAGSADVELDRGAVAKLDAASEGGSPPPAW